MRKRPESVGMAANSASLKQKSVVSALLIFTCRLTHSSVASARWDESVAKHTQSFQSSAQGSEAAQRSIVAKGTVPISKLLFCSRFQPSLAEEVAFRAKRDREGQTCPPVGNAARRRSALPAT